MNKKIEIPLNSNRYEENMIIIDSENTSNIDLIHSFILSIINKPVLPLYCDEDIEKKVLIGRAHV